MKLSKFNKKTALGQVAKLQVSGGEIGGDLNVAGSTSFEGDIDVLNTISASAGSILSPSDLSFQTQNGEITTTILGTTGEGSTLGIHDNLIYSNGTNIGIGTTDPSGKLEVNGTVVFSGLPTTDPEIAGALWNDSGTLKVSAGL